MKKNLKNIITFLNILSIVLTCYFLVFSFGLGVLGIMAKYGNFVCGLVVICFTITMFRVLVLKK